jgi:hypothetical protein
MDYRELSTLPDGTVVRLLDGRVGRIATWFHTREAVGVRMPSGTVVIVESRNLDRHDTGQLIEIRRR